MEFLEAQAKLQFMSERLDKLKRQLDSVAEHERGARRLVSFSEQEDPLEILTIAAKVLSELQTLAQP